MKTTPLKGMKDILPREQRIRDYVQGEILKTYRAAGFERISTPIMEDMENLDKSDGGDNLNLIFKVLKRGDKLEKALPSGSEKELSDMGLRYDLTLPLSRYYAANREQLPAPFKVIQTDRVYRAERPQKGRLREFVQCDIDILGDESPNAEVELIDVTARALLAIGFSDFTVHINDRRLLRGMLESFGFAPQRWTPCASRSTSWIRSARRAWRRSLRKRRCPPRRCRRWRPFWKKAHSRWMMYPRCARTRAWAARCVMCWIPWAGCPAAGMPSSIRLRWCAGRAITRGWCSK